MTVRDMINLLSNGVRWELIGASSCKRLCRSYNTCATKDKWMDKEVSGFFPTFYTSNSAIVGTVDWIEPMISIWVSGE